jgi:hypothetical protein
MRREHDVVLLSDHTAILEEITKEKLISATTVKCPSLLTGLT